MKIKFAALDTVSKKQCFSKNLKKKTYVKLDISLICRNFIKETTLKHHQLKKYHFNTSKHHELENATNSNKNTQLQRTTNSITTNSKFITLKTTNTKINNSKTSVIQCSAPVVGFIKCHFCKSYIKKVFNQIRGL